MALTDKLAAIANAIRAKTGGTATMTLEEMPSEIESIPSGGITPSGSIEITENDTYDVTQYAEAVVNVGGGGSVLDEVFGAPTLLYTATVTEPVHAINIPVGDGWKTDYDYLLFVLDLDFSTNDWLYVCADEFSSANSIPYWKKSPNVKGKNAWLISSEANNARLFSFGIVLAGQNEVGRIYTANPATQWVFQLYTPSANITNGTIKVYGGVYA